MAIHPAGRASRLRWDFAIDSRNAKSVTPPRIRPAIRIVDPVFDVGIQHVQHLPRRDDPVGAHLDGLPMRVTRTELPSGTVYRIYRGSESFAAKIKALIPFLLQVRQNVLIGDSLEDPRLVVTIAPLPRGAAQELDRRLRQHLIHPDS